MCLAMTQACIKENFPTSPNDVTEGEEVTLSMSVSVPGMEVATRALGEYGYTDGSHPSLWVVVFDQQGYLVEYAKATEQSLTGGSLNETKFSVKLHETPEPCIIHYLLNYADNLELAYGHESSLIGGLVVGPDKDVYWQRRVLQGGINDDPTYISNNFTRIPLVRNFAMITVTVDEKVDNFTLSGFYVLNRPNTGTVAPYSNGAFVNYQPNLEADQSLYDALTGAGYVGNEPDGLEFTNTAAPVEDDFSTNPTYLYENTAEDKNAVTTILIAGMFDSDDDKAFDDETVTYYKADLVTNDLVSGGTKYAHILRNFHYELKITSVIASGKDIAGAMNAAANNNLSGAVEIKDLTNVTNGTAGIYVSFTDTTLVSSAPIVLKYKFLEDVSDRTSYSNERVKISAEPGDVVSSTSKGSLITTPTTSSWYGYQELIINPQELPDYTKEQTIVLYDEATKLRREVLIRLRPKLTMEVECVPESVASVPGTPVVVNIKIPQGLNKALFPLEFAIEANTTAANNTSLKQYISPAKSENTSVRTGETIVTETNTNGTLKYAGAKSYQYIKTLSYEDYEKLSVSGTQVVLPVYFVTNIAASASTVYVSNMYFEDANDTFGNFNATYTFTNLEFDGGVPLGSDQNVTLKFNMNSTAYNTPVTITMIGLKMADGTTDQYTFTPNAAAVELSLKTTQESGNVAVLLAAENYAGAMLSAVQANEVIIPAGTISFSNLNFDRWNDTRTIYVYSDSNYSNQITSFTLSSDPGTNPELNLGEVSDDQTIYFRYQVNGMFASTTNYTASATVAQLKTGCTLEFEEQ